MIKLIILRHGQSSLNHENIFCGWIDAELTDEGLKQASNASSLIYDHFTTPGVAPGKHDESQLPTVGFASRLVRTNQTIKQIIKTLDERSKDADNKSQFSHVAEYHVVECKKHLNDTEKIEYKPVGQSTHGHNDGFKVFESWRLNERHYGSWQGQRKPAVLQKYGKEEYMRIRRDFNGKPPVVDLSKEMEPESDGVESVSMQTSGSELVYDFKEPNRKLKYKDEYEFGNYVDLPTAESLNDVIKRLESYLYEFVIPKIQETDNNTGIIVAHGSSVRSLLKILCGISDEDIKNVDIPNGIPLVVELDKDLQFQTRYYLDPELAKIKAAKVRNEGFQ